MEEVDVWTTENIHDVKGKRLYKEFDEDDWILATFRLEMLNMLVSFKTDVTSKDADRVREAVACLLIKLSQVCKYGSKLKKITKLDNGTGVRV